MILHGIRWECHVNQGSPRYADAMLAERQKEAQPQ